MVRFTSLSPLSTGLLAYSRRTPRVAQESAAFAVRPIPCLFGSRGRRVGAGQAVWPFPSPTQPNHGYPREFKDGKWYPWVLVGTIFAQSATLFDLERTWFFI